MTEDFSGSFTRQEPIPEEAIAAAERVMRSGALHRYGAEPQEMTETAMLESEFAAMQGARYCLAVASGGYALATALRALGAEPDEPVLTNAFTLAPVPGAIASVGARPVFVETTEALTIDFDDLARKAGETGARLLLLSHMRGHICDMDRLMDICHAAGLSVIEDCAHTMGSRWAGVPSGRHGLMSCYSTQTYKHINAGEGGLLISDDPQAMARAVLLSGSYMFFDSHGAGPDAAAFDEAKYTTPNISGRMDNLRAAILRPQLALLAERCRGWNDRYRAIETELRDVPGVRIIERPEPEQFVGSSIQFMLPGWSEGDISDLIGRCRERGVELMWFGARSPAGYTSRYDSWRYATAQSLPATDAVYAVLLDMRISLTFSMADCTLIARILGEEISRPRLARTTAQAAE